MSEELVYLTSENPRCDERVSSHQRPASHVSLGKSRPLQYDVDAAAGCPLGDELVSRPWRGSLDDDSV